MIELKEQHPADKVGERRQNFSNLTTFIKTQAALVVGSFADFLVTYLLVEAFNCWYVTGTAIGNVAGAMAQFILSRNWVFNKNSKQKATSQIIRFVIMWAGNILLSVLGVYLLTYFFNLYYLLSKLIVSISIGISYTYLLSKKFVFK